MGNPNKDFGAGTYGFQGKFCQFGNGSIGVYLNEERALILKDSDGNLCCKIIWEGDREWGNLYKESVPFSMFDDGFDNLNEHNICGDIHRLILDGIKYRKITELLKDD